MENIGLNPQVRSQAPEKPHVTGRSSRFSRRVETGEGDGQVRRSMRISGQPMQTYMVGIITLDDKYVCILYNKRMVRLRK